MAGAPIANTLPVRPLLLCFSCVTVFAQPFSFGVRAGVPLTDFFNGTGTATNPYSSITNRYLIGPTAELRLPFGLGIEFDALYRHYSYSSPGFRTASPPFIQLKYDSEEASGSAWEFALLAKYRFHAKLARPYVDAGAAWNRVSGLNALTCAINCSFTSTPPSLRQSTVTGFVAGAGIDVHVLFLHLSPEVRYTRWGGPQFQSVSGGFSSNRNQVEFLLGITY